MRAGRVLRGRCAEIKQNLPHVPAFSETTLAKCSQFFRAFERRSRAISVPNAALTQPRAALTPCVLRSARGARRPSFAWAVRRNHTKFATRSRVFSRNFARFRTPKSRNLNAKCNADSAASCIEVHWRLPCCAAHAAHDTHAGRVFACAVHRNQTKFATHSRVFSRNFARFRTLKSRNLGTNCSAGPAASCADVLRVSQLTQCTPAEFCVGAAPKSNKICPTFARFLANFCALSNAEVAQSRCQMQH